MGVGKGTDNFARYRRAGIEANARLIANELEQRQRRRIAYLNLSALAADISDRTKIHRTTLVRNARYKKLLLTHLARQSGATQVVRDEDASPELLRAKLFDARLENRNMLNRMRILEKRLERLGTVTNEESDCKVHESKRDWYVAFNDTAMLLVLLMERLNRDGDQVTLDVAEARLIDLSAPSAERVVAGPERTRAFVEFYQTIKAQVAARTEGTHDRA